MKCYYFQIKYQLQKELRQKSDKVLSLVVLWGSAFGAGMVLLGKRPVVWGL